MSNALFPPSMRFQRIAGWISRAPAVLPIVIALLVILVPLTFFGQYQQRQVVMIMVYTLIVSGLNLTFGFSGDLALGHVAMFATGAYVTAILTNNGVNDILVALACSAAAAAVVGLVSGAPGLRLSSWSLAITSLFVVLLIPRIVVLFTDLTGGRQGLSGIFNPTLFGLPLKFTGFYLLSGAITFLWLLGIRNFVDSRYGRALLVLRESRQLTQSLGLSPYKMRIRTYLIGSLPAGAAGTLYAYLVGFVSPEAFTLNLAIAVLAAAVVGGTSSVWGAAVGSAILVLGPLQSSAFEQYSILTYGIFLLIAGLAFASGIAGLAKNAVKKFGGALGKLHVIQQARLLKNVQSDDGAVVIPGQRLVVQGVSKAFGGVKALDGAAITAEPGRITAILGSNGAGKTTLLNTISGFVSPDSGTITVGNTNLVGLAPDRIGQRGVGRTFQTPQIPHAMTVLDIVESGRFHQGPGLLASIMRLPSYRQAQRDNRTVALAALRFAGLEHLMFEDAQSLPLGTRRLLEVVRAVAREPNLLLLDEPAAGLDDVGLTELAQLVRRIRDAGGTVIIVEHNVPFVMDLADDVHVMELGRTIASGTPGQIAHNPAVIASYLGESLTAQADLEELR